MKKALLIAGLALASALAHADDKACLADLAGNFQHTFSRGKQETVLSVRQDKSGWSFSQPASTDRDRLFRDHFEGKEPLKAQIIPAKQLAGVGALMLTPFVEEGSQLRNVKAECGLTVDDVYLVRLDLSRADKDLLENIVTLGSALSGQKSDAAVSDADIARMRQQKYFAGETLKLEGVISTIVPVLVQKASAN